ncbi:MAG: hypothetical protein AAF500_08920 [Myxococcota bacterium]
MEQTSSREKDPEERFAEGSFTRDTLIHALGTLASSLLERAFADESVLGAYHSWIAKCGQDPSLADAGEPLVTTGLRQGRCMLVARGRADEFCVVLEHKDFRAFVAAGFKVGARVLSGVCVAKFEGDMHSAIQFSRVLNGEILAVRGELPHRRQQTLSN